MWIGDRKIDGNSNEKAAYNYLNQRLADEGASDDEINGVRWYAVIDDEKGPRMPDLVRLVWQNGKIISVKTLDIITRVSSDAKGGAERALDKFGQLKQSRQADNVLYWLNKIKNPRQAANDIAEQLDAMGANGDSARFASSGVGDDFDLTKPLGANAGPMGDTGSDTGTGPEVEPPPAPKAPAEGARGGSDDYNCACGGDDVVGGETGEDEWIDPTDLLPF